MTQSPKDSNSNDKLKTLKERLQKLRPSELDSTKNGKMSSSERKLLGIAARMGLEIVIALGIGLGIGYYLDKLFSTKPLFLILFALFGIAAGVLNVYRLIKGNEYRSGYQKGEMNDKS